MAPKGCMSINKLNSIMECCIKIDTVLFCPSCLSMRPDGTKKAYVRLTPDYDALDVANKIGII
ncbi:Nucleotide-binding, alpha-beta plait [Cynara cardunculus var. scolymus]|uniref:Nucleotide-binding, alpha-beta plait n=1 Tax=Cynara cardunculus var. scolymus TaxID=59895 RepID=A0A103YIS7_CYNCS|nr:Nucleotide-binding, alpha-beta plait [Cynara cardunculus var. scolymus]